MRDEDIDTLVFKPKKVFNKQTRCSSCSHRKDCARLFAYVSNTFSSIDCDICEECWENLKKTVFKDGIK